MMSRPTIRVEASGKNEALYPMGGDLQGQRTTRRNRGTKKKAALLSCEYSQGGVVRTDLSLVIPPEASSLSAMSFPFATVKTASVAYARRWAAEERQNVKKQEHHKSDGAKATRERGWIRNPVRHRTERESGERERARQTDRQTDKRDWGRRDSHERSPYHSPLCPCSLCTTDLLLLMSQT